MKDMFKPSHSSTSFKVNKKQNAVSISSEEQSSLIGKVENLFGDFSSEFGQIGGGLKVEVGKKIAGLKKKSSPMMLPSEVYEGLIFSADSISN